MEMQFTFPTNDTKTYGPVHIPHPCCHLIEEQECSIRKWYGLHAVISHVSEFGIRVGSACTRQCRHALALGRVLSRLVDIPRLLDEVRLLDGVYPI